MSFVNEADEAVVELPVGKMTRDGFFDPLAELGRLRLVVGNY